MTRHVALSPFEDASPSVFPIQDQILEKAMKLSFHPSHLRKSVQIVCAFLLTLSLFVAGVVPAAAAPSIPQIRQDSDTQATADPNQTAYTVPAVMNVRAGPGTTFSVVTSVPALTVVEIIAENDAGDWVQARLDGVEGEVWLAKWLLSFDDAVEPASDATNIDATNTDATNTDADVTTTADSAETTDTSADTESAAADGAVIAVTTPSRMNVRGGPGTDYNVVTTVAAGTQAQVRALAVSDQWLQVDLSGQSDPVWLYRSLTTVRGSLADLPRLSDDELPPRPQPQAAQARSAAPAASASTVVNAPLPTGGGSFAYGVQAHMIHTGQQGTVMDKTREMGFNWVKQQIEWKIFESNPGQYGFGDIGPIIGAANERGINLLFSVVNAPDWARSRFRQQRGRSARGSAGVCQLRGRVGVNTAVVRSRPSKCGTSRIYTTSGATNRSTQPST
ncbi:MAG: SH3 domain-containing protein [Caldilineaceae bacterium]